MQALDGLRVLDLNRRYPGAFAAMYLADFGAEVIKIDPPPEVLNRITGGVLSGDVWDPRFAAFYAPDRNKLSMMIDFRKKRGREVFYALVKTADVLVEGFRPGTMSRLGCGYEVLRDINPALIYCAATGFGSDGPYSRRPGHDMNYLGVAGALSLVGPRDGRPCLPSNWVADMAGGGLHALVGVLLALQARERTRRGQFVDVSYLDGVISLMAVSEAVDYFYRGKLPRRVETATTGGMPWGSVYLCKDGGYITLGCAELHFWENLCHLLGREDLVPLHEPPPPQREWVGEELSKIFATRTRDEWTALLQDKEICFAPVNSLEEAFGDPQVRARQMILSLDDPQAGNVRQIGVAIKLSETPGSVRRLGVPLGTDTDEVLSRLGFNKREIDALREEGAVA